MSSASGDASTIAVVDYGMGNRRSVEKALEHIGARAIVSSDPQTLRAADGLIVPGVGSFPRAMQNLRERGLDHLLRERVAAATPLLGVCLGLQVLFERSTEHGGADGLGILAGTVQALRATSLKLPHIGWNEVRFTRASPLTRELSQRCAFYHVHSFAPVPERDEDVLGVVDYGEPVNLAQLERIARALEVPVQYGGGLRSAAAVAGALNAGAARVIIGTAALRDERLLRSVIATHGPERVLVSVDVRDGRAAAAGWTERSELGAQDAFALLQEHGVEHLIYTSVERDGMMSGPDLAQLQRLAATVRGRLTYSGGVGTLAHLEALAGIGEDSLEGVIVGKALYERRFTIAEARAALDD